MAELDNITLMMAIQAVNAEITKYEHLLTSETLRDREVDPLGLGRLDVGLGQARIRREFLQQRAHFRRCPGVSGPQSSIRD